MWQKLWSSKITCLLSIAPAARHIIISGSVLASGHSMETWMLRRFHRAFWLKWVKVPPGDNKTWEFDENQRIVGAKELRCHLFIRSGQLQFLGDCTHELKGITVPMEDVDG
jgi:hypothetical protein